MTLEGLAFLGGLAACGYIAVKVAAPNVRARRDAGPNITLKGSKTAPIWPPTQPPDWGDKERRAYQNRVMNAETARAAGVTGQITSARPLVIPVWETEHRKLQIRDSLQIRWAQNERGQWVSVEWGNYDLRPTDGGPLPVFQLMQREDNRDWVWVPLGRNVSLDWQQGERRVEKFTLQAGKPITLLRPCGTVVGTDATDNETWEVLDQEGRS